MKTFEVGKEYTCNSICDSNCTFVFTVVKRTKAFVTLKYNGSLLRRKIFINDGVECCMPLGTYSMAPLLRAKSKVLIDMNDELTTVTCYGL